MVVEAAAVRERRRIFLLALFGLAYAAALWLEWVVERGDPLWLDEAWTVAIAGQHRWIDFFHQVYWDVNAPLYYLLMHLWTAVAGQSDLAWRLPSLVLATVTPLAVAVRPVEGLPDADRLAWAATLALWFPAISFAQEARCYALLLFLSALQTLAFIRLLAAPSTGRAALWASLGALAILTHYDAVIAGGVQGLLYLALHRGRAVRTWPAALAFIPAFAWFAYHLPRIAAFARPDIAWYAPLGFGDLTKVAGFVAGTPSQLWALAFVASWAILLRVAWPPKDAPEPPAAAPWLAVLAALIAAAALVAIGFFRPSFAYRYLTPEAPGLLLGVVLVARLLVGRRIGAAFAGVIAAYLVVSGGAVVHGLRMAPHRYNYEVASEVLERAHPSRLVFLWDHPVDPILHPEQLQAAGGAFFRRDGDPIPVDAVVLKPGEDPNRRLLDEAAPPGSAILWVYDPWVHGTAAREHPPAVGKLDPAWSCREFGRGRWGIYACSRGGSGA